MNTQPEEDLMFLGVKVAPGSIDHCRKTAHDVGHRLLRFHLGKTYKYFLEATALQHTAHQDAENKRPTDAELREQIAEIINPEAWDKPGYRNVIGRQAALSKADRILSLTTAWQDAEIARLRDALRCAIHHIEHMGAWITKQNAGYSFESIGEDMPSLREALAPQPSATDAGE